jgi:hypothetical protein
MRAWALWIIISLTVAPFALLATAAMVGTVGFVGIVLIRQNGILGLVLSGGALMASYAVAIAVHELGHVLGGGGVGWTARFVRVGPVCWTRLGKSWRIGWTPRSSWLTGKVETVLGPPDAWRLVVLLMAGPVANFILAAIAAGFVVIPIPFLLRCVAGLFTVISFCLGAWSLVPLRERGEASDGLNLWRLWAHGALPVTLKRVVLKPVTAGRG